MNKRKGFFRLTLVLSFLCGILTLYFSEDIFRDATPGFRSRDIKITVPLPSDWENKTLQQKLNSIDELLISLIRSEYLEKKEEDEAHKEWIEFLVKRHPITLNEQIEELEKENEKRKKAGLKPLAPDSQARRMGFPRYYHSDLTSREQENVKRRLRQQIISDEKTLPNDRERRNYHISSGHDWRELSFLVFIGFIIGFAPVWLIYAFTRWVVIGFILKGFKS